MATHWKKLTNPNYLGAYSLEEGKEIVLTIKTVRQEAVVGSDGKKEDCIVCYWQENQKPMILNVTNCKAITKVAGTPYIEQWAGVRVQIGTEKVAAFGTVTDALRIRTTKPAQTKEETILCEECKKPITACFGMTASQWAAYSREKMKRCLCESCANKAAEVGKK